jgi:hypothetical protein
MIAIPFISALMYLAGGQGYKAARWLIGIPLASIGIIVTHSLWPVLCIPTYWIATSAFPYGENSWLNIFGDWGKWAICGLVFGLASIPILGYLGILQGVVSSLAFVGLHYLDEKDILKNPWQEILRGFVGTSVFFFF